MAYLIKNKNGQAYYRCKSCGLDYTSFEWAHLCECWCSLGQRNGLIGPQHLHNRDIKGDESGSAQAGSAEE